MEITRRHFLEAAGLAGVGALAATLGGCATPTTSAGGKGGDAEGSADDGDVVATHDADIVICGGGMSGLTAAVEAGYQGLKAVVLERQADYGGNGLGVEGYFAIGSRLQKELGITTTVSEMISAELTYCAFRSNGKMWSDMISRSGANFDWHEEQGVLFSGEVRQGSRGGKVQTAHLFKEKQGSPANFIEPMATKARSLGAEIVCNMRATELIQDGSGVIVGVRATSGQGGTEEFLGNAVILCTGGFGGNEELIRKAGWKNGTIEFRGMAANEGDGYSMAMAVGAMDNIAHGAGLAAPILQGTVFNDAINRCVAFGGAQMWVNEECDRFVNEDIAKTTNSYAVTNALRLQKGTWSVFDREFIEDGLKNDADLIAKFDEIVAAGYGDIFESETLDGLPAKFGLNQAAFDETVQRYNEMAASGSDEEYGKQPDFMTPIENGPFYIMDFSTFYFNVGIGGIGTNKRFEVIADNGEAIPGLYSAGVDGSMLYPDCYTINIPCSCCANNVYSARMSVRNAMTYMGATPKDL